MKAVYSDRTVYTPFPDYELTNPNTGTDEIRITYRLAGRIVALRANTTAGNKLYYPLTDHLGNVTALSDVDGVLEPGSAARYDPFGGFTSAPTTNPSVTDRGFTGHRHNNTGTYDLGLIYMNARYYLPEVGRFISPDTIVPEPGNLTNPSERCVLPPPFPGQQQREKSLLRRTIDTGNGAKNARFPDSTNGFANGQQKPARYVREPGLENNVRFLLALMGFWTVEWAHANWLCPCFHR